MGGDESMSYVKIEKLLDKADNSIYKLVILASKRALELTQGAAKLVNIDSKNRATTIALTEIKEGRISVKLDVDDKKKEKKKKKSRK